MAADDDAIRHAADTLVAALARAGKTVTTAESCTGGWIAKALTDIAGSSAVFGLGITSYSNAAKQALLGVRAATLEADGAVSAATVREMAEGALEQSGADFAVAVSGIAGPDGGSDDKPIGTVWFGFGSRNASKITIDTDRRRFDGDRDAVRRESVLHALAGIQDRLAR